MEQPDICFGGGDAKLRPEPGVFPISSKIFLYLGTL